MAQFITIQEAADRLAVKPWQVVRLIALGALKQVVYVDADSVTEFQEHK